MKTLFLVGWVILSIACSNDMIQPDSKKIRSQYYTSKEASHSPSSSQQSADGSTLNEVTFVDSSGISSSYKINLPVGYKNNQYGLHIHLHGDGARGYKDFPNKEFRHNLIGVTVKTPAADLKWGRDLETKHGEYVNELIQNELLRKYNIDKNKIIFSTVSGGSHFMTGVFIPKYGHLYKSKAFVMCGGIAPLYAFVDPSTLKTFRIHWHTTIGERSDIALKIRGSIDAYTAAALSSGISQEDLLKLQTSKITGEGAHCYFDNKGYTSGIQEAIDLDFQKTLGI